MVRNLVQVSTIGFGFHADDIVCPVSTGQSVSSSYKIRFKERAQFADKTPLNENEFSLSEQFEQFRSVTTLIIPSCLLRQICSDSSFTRQLENENAPGEYSLEVCEESSESR